MKTNRRDFIRTSSLALGGVLLAQQTVGAKGSASRMMAAPADVRVRRNVSKLSVTDLNSDLYAYAQAVRVMKKRDAKDPTSWAFQASIHLNACPHGNWFFLPWHRAYLKYFEDICREASGKTDFSLPYWNWTDYPQVPAAFWGSDNPLYDSKRQSSPQSVASSEFVGTSVIQDILNIDSFQDFGSYQATALRGGGGATGKLEGTPHNYIHRFIGGDMATMLSPLDPIFWLHHANVDRIWATWNDNGHANPTDSTYTNLNLDSFYNSKGKTGMKVGDTFNTRAANLNYIYDTEITRPVMLAKKSAFRFLDATKAVVLNSVPIRKLTTTSFELAPNTALVRNVKGLLARNALFQSEKQGGTPTQSDKQEVKLVISDIQLPNDEDFFVRVFINCDYLDQNTPINDPHYVGSFTFFGAMHNMDAGHMDMAPGHAMAEHHKLTFVLDVSDALEKVADVSNIASLTSKVRVQLLAIPFGASSVGEFLPGKIEIVVAEKVG